MNCRENQYIFNPHPTKGGWEFWGKNIQKSRKFHELPRKSIQVFNPPTPPGEGGTGEGGRGREGGTGEGGREPERNRVTS